MISLHAKDFQCEILKEAIKKDSSKNIALSPIGLLFPLALISKGTKNQTLAELQKVLNDSSNKNLYINNLDQIYSTIKDEECLKIANAILTKVKVTPSFSERAEQIRYEI